MPVFEIPASRVVKGSPNAPGTLLLNEPTLYWQPDDPSMGQKFGVALHTIQGALQRSKKTAQMRIGTSSGPLVLEFSSFEDRDQAINQMTPILAKYSERKGIEPGGPHADVKRQLLQEDKDLSDLYDATVKEGHISDANFWKARQGLVVRRLGGVTVKQQQVGLSSALLADLQTTSDGKGQVNLTITPQFMQQVFAEKPHVHRAFVENVPQAMSETEFWTRFAKHEIRVQNRSKQVKGRQEPPDPLFSRLTANEPAAMDNSRMDPTLNLNVDQHDRQDNTAAKEAAPHGRGEAIARDMNRHSAVVLQGRAALEEQSSKDRPDAGAGPTALATDESEDARRKRNRSELEDLREEAFPAIEELKIHNPRRYFEKSKQRDEDVVMADGPTKDDVIRGLQNTEGTGIVDPNLAEVVLQEMQRQNESPLEENWTTSLPAALVPKLQTLLRTKVLIVNEFLRQFWNCMPLKASASKERAAEKLQGVLKTKQIELDNFKYAAEAKDRNVVTQFLTPVMNAIEAAVLAFEAELQPSHR